ncbi:hypothetical protein F8M41_024584 [Gigaspora margarita]|uniref:Uncharacterized protein n=1 Tax=Gigaspora margarita TaxID=4874 RepID=A0A8H4AAS9_GIGMA|nr:hypothetical protein F8M41_024584 [Gigaspora margarita]
MSSSYHITLLTTISNYYKNAITSLQEAHKNQTRTTSNHYNYAIEALQQCHQSTTTMLSKHRKNAITSLQERYRITINTTNHQECCMVTIIRKAPEKYKNAVKDQKMY